MDNSGSLKKAFDILEFVLNSNGIPVTPSDAARALGLNASTCVRLLNVLITRGYIIHKSRREGYVPGPAAFSFNNSGCFYASLVKISESIVRNIALNIGRLVLISTYSEGRKFIMNYFDGSNLPRQNLNNAYNDLYTTVSGQLLLAHLPEKELDNYISKNGLPGDAWNKIDSKVKLLKEISKIKGREFHCFNDDDKWWCIGIPIQVSGQPCVSISTSVLDKNSIPKTLELLKNAATEIKEFFNKEESSRY